MGAKNEDAFEATAANDAAEVFKRIANLVALHLVIGKPQPEQISLLSTAGYAPSEIARLVGTTRNTVSVTLSQRRKGKSKKKKH